MRLAMSCERRILKMSLLSIICPRKINTATAAAKKEGFFFLAGGSEIDLPEIER